MPGGLPTIILCGGKGTFPVIEPTLIETQEKHLKIVAEEIFGPVATITPFDSEDEVLGYANGTAYGLAASVWTVWLWMTGLKVVPANQAGVFTAMLPVSAALVGVIVLGERLSPLQGVAFAAALAGVLLATLPARKPAAARA